MGKFYTKTTLDDLSLGNYLLCESGAIRHGSAIFGILKLERSGLNRGSLVSRLWMNETVFLSSPPIPPFQGGTALKGVVKEGNEGWSMFLNNKKELQKNRTALRSNATPQEVIMWSRLRMSRLGFKFRRQHSIGRYIVDFYCPEKKVAIELDGSQHLDNEKYDKTRTDYLNACGITVLRFWDQEVNTNMEGVLLKILTTIEGELPPNPPLATTPPRRLGTPPWKGGVGER